MSTSAFARNLSFNDLGPTRARVYRKTRRASVSLVPVPWHTVAIASTDAVSKTLGQLKRPPPYVLSLFALAMILHVAFAWYVAHHTGTKPVRQRHEVAVELVRPKAPEPKVEPPKPLPPKPQQVQKQAQVLPPIQTAAPETNNTPAVASSEPPVAVTPITTAPVEAPPAPVTPPIGRAGYLNNPPPAYPAAAARAGWQGIVKLRVHVLSNGKVDSVEVQKSSGRQVLDDEAVRTVKNWTFTPSKRGDTPIDGWANVPIEFTLDQ